MAASLASIAWMSGPLAPGPTPGGGAGLGLAVEVVPWATVVGDDDAEVGAGLPGSVAPVVASSSWAPPVAVDCGEPDELQPANPTARRAAAIATLSCFRATANSPPWFGEGTHT